MGVSDGEIAGGLEVSTLKADECVVALINQLNQIEEEKEFGASEKVLWMMDYIEGLITGDTDKRDFLTLAEKEISDPLETMKGVFRMFILGQIPYDIGRKRSGEEFNEITEVVGWRGGLGNDFSDKEHGHMIGGRLFVSRMEQGRMFFIDKELSPVVRLGLSACDVMTVMTDKGLLVAHISYKHKTDVRNVMRVWQEEFGVNPEEVKVVMTPILGAGGRNWQLGGKETDHFDFSPADLGDYVALGVKSENILVTRTNNPGDGPIENNAIVYVVPPYGIGVGYVDIKGNELDGDLKSEKDFLKF